MTDAYERLISLYSHAGFDVTPSGYAEAEVYALCSGIELVESAVKSAKNGIFYTLADSPDGISAYAKMLGIDCAKTDYETLEGVITARLGANYGDCVMADEYISELQLMDRLSLESQGGGFVLENVTPQTLFFLGSFIAGGIPFSVPVYLDGGGVTFAQWDSFAKTAAFYGSLHLPFSVLDTMRAELLDES